VSRAIPLSSRPSERGGERVLAHALTAIPPCCGNAPLPAAQPRCGGRSVGDTQGNRLAAGDLSRTRLAAALGRATTFTQTDNCQTLILQSTLTFA
jgi:hypothetical protein